LLCPAFAIRLKSLTTVFISLQTSKIHHCQSIYPANRTGATKQREKNISMAEDTSGASIPTDRTVATAK
jgi:hypothetical protein